jgi:hypothetical protein
MKAKIVKAEQYNACQPSNKETVNTLTVLAVVKGEIKEVACARFYMGRSAQASVVYCCLWIHNKCSGKGNAGGYGYHKESAALQDAITSAGIELYGTAYKSGVDKTEKHYNCQKGETEITKIDYSKRAHIGGCGSTAMIDALTDIARDVCGYKKVKVDQS